MDQPDHNDQYGISFPVNFCPRKMRYRVKNVNLRKICISQIPFSSLIISPSNNAQSLTLLHLTIFLIEPRFLTSIKSFHKGYFHLNNVSSFMSQNCKRACA